MKLFLKQQTVDALRQEWLEESVEIYEPLGD